MSCFCRVLSHLCGKRSPFSVFLPKKPGLQALSKFPSILAQVYPNHSKFWAMPSNILVLDTMKSFVEEWSYLKKVPGTHNSEILLSPLWKVRATDNRMSGQDFSFYFRGERLFTVGFWDRNLTMDKDISPIIHELRSLIMPRISDGRYRNKLCKGEL